MCNANNNRNAFNARYFNGNMARQQWRSNVYHPQHGVSYLAINIVAAAQYSSSSVAAA